MTVGLNQLGTFRTETPTAPVLPLHMAGGGLTQILLRQPPGLEMPAEAHDRRLVSPATHVAATRLLPPPAAVMSSPLPPPVMEEAPKDDATQLPVEVKNLVRTVPRLPLRLAAEVPSGLPPPVAVEVPL